MIILAALFLCAAPDVEAQVFGRKASQEEAGRGEEAEQGTLRAWLKGNKAERKDLREGHRDARGTHRSARKERKAAEAREKAAKARKKAIRADRKAARAEKRAVKKTEKARKAKGGGLGRLFSKKD